VDLVRLPPNALKPGQRLTFSLRDADGTLLFASGSVLPNTEPVRELLQRGAFTQAYETEAYRREMTSRVNELIHQGASLNEIARVKPEFDRVGPRSTVALSESALWADIQLRLHNLLKDPRPETFLERFEPMRREISERLVKSPDQALLILVHDASQGISQYTARHALLCMALCHLTAERLDWPVAEVEALGAAALSMNLSLGLLQDRLAQQHAGLTADERRQLAGHGDRAAALLQSFGVTDRLWLDAVRLHHDTGPGTLSQRAPAERLARLLGRIDVFAARLSPRTSRKAQTGAQASRAVFLDETKQQDEAGAALIKAVGLYPPGSLVRLANGEEAVVLKRGLSATEPLVAAVIGKSGNPLTEPVPRDTRLATQAITQSLAPHELRLRLSIDKLMRLAV
jgi:HD-GYP domain-containing protein (c-di-GMP phosphodiesterase class II)